MKVSLKTVLKLDKIGFSISALMTVYLVFFQLLNPYKGILGEPNPAFPQIISLIYALIMCLLCGINVLKISKIRKKYIKANHSRFDTVLPETEK